MEVNKVEEREINNIVVEEVLIEDTDYEQKENKFEIPMRRVAVQTGPELSSEEKLKAQFSTVGNRKNPRKSTNDIVKQSTKISAKDCLC
jgi:uncharacterized protein YheU (UPF0270 family)